VSSWLLNISMSAKRTAAIARSADGELAAYFANETMEQSKNTAELQKQVGDLLDTAEEKALYAEIGTARDAYVAARDRVMALKAEGKTDEARALYDQTFAAVMDRYIGKVKELQVLQQKEIDAQTARCSTARSAARPSR
jgi:methyl-accepting chemotaxis protein